MADMQWNYEGYFTFVVWDGADGPFYSHLTSNLPVEAFSVKGGTTYTSFNAKQETGIKAQLEKASVQKNITLYLPLKKNHKDMKAALDLSDFYYDKIQFGMSLYIQVKSGVPGLRETNWFNHYSLQVRSASVEAPPLFSAGKYAVKISFPFGYAADGFLGLDLKR